MIHSRFDKLNASLQTSDLGGVIRNPVPTRRYCSGWHFYLTASPDVFLYAI